MTAAPARTRTPDLRRLQQWLAFVMRHPQTADVAVRARGATRLFPLRQVLAGAIVAPNDRMAVADRLQVYNGAYLARLQEVLAADYPALQHLVGDDEWRTLTARYVDRHPSRHPNLNRFGKQLPAFARQQRWLPRRAFAAELAALECAISSAFDAPACVPLTQAQIAAVDATDWPRARLTMNPSLQVLTFRHSVNAWYIAFKNERASAPPRPRRTHVAVYRNDHRVFRLDLPPAAHRVLAALIAGEPLGRALLRARGGDVGAWFRDWAAEGFFTAVRIAGRRPKR